MNIQLHLYTNERETLLNLIKEFWMAHNNYTQTNEESNEDLNLWTSKNHQVYFIMKDEEIVGFVHMASRGNKIDWLEDLFVLPKYQNQGIGSIAINLIEDIVKEYSESMYIEVSARNQKAINLYHKLNYDCLNTLTIRKDFNPQDFDTISEEKICNYPFFIKKKK